MSFLYFRNCLPKKTLSATFSLGRTLVGRRATNDTYPAARQHVRPPRQLRTSSTLHCSRQPQRRHRAGARRPPPLTSRPVCQRGHRRRCRRRRQPRRARHPLRRGCPCFGGRSRLHRFLWCHEHCCRRRRQQHRPPLWPPPPSRRAPPLTVPVSPVCAPIAARPLPAPRRSSTTCGTRSVSGSTGGGSNAGRVRGGGRQTRERLTQDGLVSRVEAEHRRLGEGEGTRHVRLRGE